MREALALSLIAAIGLCMVAGATAAQFQEISVLYDEDFTGMPIGCFPVGWQIRSNEDATPNYRVVEFAPSASGRALQSFDGGITWGNQKEGHALIIAPGIKPLEDPTSKILVEITLWIDKDAIWRSYLFPAGIVWPPYKDIGAKDATRPIDNSERQRYRVQHVYDPLNATIETYFEGVRVPSGNTSFRAATITSYPLEGKRDFNIGIYTQGKRSSDIYWERIRVVEIKR